MLITNVACMQESKFQVQILKFFPGLLEFLIGTCLGIEQGDCHWVQDIFCKDAVKKIKYQWALIQKFYSNGMDQDGTQEKFRHGWSDF